MKRLLLVFLLVLSACATTGRGGGNGDRYWIKSDDAYVGMDDAVSLLHYGNYVRGLSVAERERETDRVRSAYQRDKNDFRRLQYVLALTASDLSVSERKQAQQLIEPLLDGKHDSGLSALAALLGTHLSAVAQAQQQGAQQGSQQAQQAQKRIDELEKKLDAVKDIERSLLRREKGKL